MPIISLKSGTKSRSLLVGNPYFVPSSYESIASVTAAGGETSLNFTSIPGTYVALQIRGISKDTYSGAAGEATDTVITFNNDGGSNYGYHQLRGNGTAAAALAATGTSNMAAVITQVYGTATNIFGVSIVDIHDYASTTKFKTVRGFSGGDLNDGTTKSNLRLGSGLWRSTSAITSIQILTVVSGFTAGSTFALYGIKGA
jgi:hypothetical protein